MTRKPYLAGGMIILSGYFSALVARSPRSVSTEFAKFRGREQMTRLKEFFTTRFGFMQRPTAR
jgi:hypothetical protein